MKDDESKFINFVSAKTSALKVERDAAEAVQEAGGLLVWRKEAEENTAITQIFI